MKRPYSRITRRQGVVATPVRLAAALLGLALLALLLLRVALPGAFTALATPFWKAGTALTGAVGNAVPLESRSSLAEDRERLVRENQALQNQNAVLAARVGDLERLVGVRSEMPASIAAGVLARPPVSPYDLLVIDRGEASGIVPGAAAFGPGRVPLGTVADASTGTARISLYSTTGRVTEAWAGAARSPVRLIGTGAGGFDAEVPGTAGIVVGDLIYVPGPGALPIGTVTEIVTDPSSPTILLRIRALVNPFSITWLTVAPQAP